MNKMPLFCYYLPNILHIILDKKIMYFYLSDEELRAREKNPWVLALKIRRIKGNECRVFMYAFVDLFGCLCV